MPRATSLSLALVALVGALALALAQSPASPSPSPSPSPASASAGPDWTYQGGGSGWGGLCSGVQQSPIDIDLPEGVGGLDSQELRVHYPVVYPWQHDIRVENTGRDIRVVDPEGAMGFLIFKDVKYRVSHISFHSPSEHTIRGEVFPLEMQIYHEKQGQSSYSSPEYAAISVLYRAGHNASRWLEKAFKFNHLPTNAGMHYALDEVFQLGEGIRGLHQGYYEYHGSITHPPCTTNVEWFVLETPQMMSLRQVLIIDGMFKGNASFAGGRGNNRAVQSLGDRKVAYHNHKQRGDGDERPIHQARSNSLQDQPESVSGAPQFEVAASPESPPNPTNPADLNDQYVNGDLGLPAMIPKLYAEHGKNWGDRCNAGRLQSPIDIHLQLGNPHGDFQMSPNWEEVNVTVIQNVGFAIQLEGNMGYIQIGKLKYSATQITFHSPAEHTIDGRRAALEMQIVHEIPDKYVGGSRSKFAIVSVLFHANRYEESDFLKTLAWDRLPINEGGSTPLTEKVNLGLLKGVSDGYYSYAGSLSRPPCTEGVKRFVLRTVQEISFIQLRAFQRIFNGNVRHLQALNSRGVLVHDVNAHTEVLPMRRPVIVDPSLLPL